MENKGTAASRYNTLATDRQTFLDRARDAALYTIPSLIPPEGHTPSTRFYKPYQSLGSRGVNNLAGKLLMALLPPSSTTFFRLSPSKKVLKELAEGEQSVLEL